MIKTSNFILMCIEFHHILGYRGQFVAKNVHERKTVGRKDYCRCARPHKKKRRTVFSVRRSAIKAPMRIPVLVFLSAEHPVKERHHADQQSQ